MTDSGLECIVNGTNAHPSKSRHVSYWSLTLSAKPLPMFFSIPKNVLPLSTYSLPVFPSGANQTHDAPVKPLQAALLPSPSIVALVVKNPPASTGGKRHGLDPWVRTILRRRPGQPTPVFLPGESHGWRSLVGCSPCTELDTTETT